MNKQELIEKLKSDLTAMSEIKGKKYEYDRGYEQAIKEHLAMLSYLDESEKPVVPRCVADMIVKRKEQCDNLVTTLVNLGAFGDVQKWIRKGDNGDTFAKAWLYGYEVEKEQLYTVEIPNPNIIGAERTVLMKNGFKQIVMLRVYDDNWRTVKGYQLTEAEIKKDFEWAFRWAKEVEE